MLIPGWFRACCAYPNNNISCVPAFPYGYCRVVHITIVYYTYAIRIRIRPVNIYARGPYKSNPDGVGGRMEFGRHVCAVNANERRTAPRAKAARVAKTGGVRRLGWRRRRRPRLLCDVFWEIIETPRRCRPKILLRTNADDQPGRARPIRSGRRENKNKNDGRTGRINGNRPGAGVNICIYSAHSE